MSEEEVKLPKRYLPPRRKPGVVAISRDKEDALICYLQIVVTSSAQTSCHTCERNLRASISHGFSIVDFRDKELDRDKRVVSSHSEETTASIFSEVGTTRFLVKGLISPSAALVRPSLKDAEDRYD